MRNFVVSLIILLGGLLSYAGNLIETSVEFQHNPVGISLSSPRFSWKIISNDFGLRQENYRIEVAQSISDLKANNSLIWDSGKVNSEQSHLISYSGPKLMSNCTYWWKVTIWLSDGSKAESKIGKFLTSCDDKATWTASWIGLNDSANIIVKDNRTVLPVRYARKRFSIAKQPVKAILSISGIGSSYCYINGNAVSDDIFGPLPSWYDASVSYLTYDVTDLLSIGGNVIAVALGNGRYFPMRKEGMEAWGLPRLIAQLNVEYSDGSNDTINTDTTWKVTANGPIRANNEYDGEIYDATMELGEWTKIGYDDRDWLNATVMKAPEGKLVAQRSPSLKIMEVIKPTSIRKVDADRYIVDMGQNMVGIEQVKLKGKKNCPIKMRFSEVLKADDDSQLYVDNLRSALAEDIYIPNSDGEFSWRPEFVYHGYRFMEISGVTEQPVIDDIEGLVIYDKMPTTGSFTCSNEILNKLHQNAYWGIRGNYRGMPTDCPQRDERHGWLGDRTTGALGESFLFDNVLLYRKWLADIEESMSENGSISDVSPRYWTLHQDDVTWPAAYFYIADMLYRQFGDDYSIRNRYDSMKRWIKHMTDCHMIDNIITSDTYGDWCLPPESLELIHSNDPNRKTDGQLLSTAVFYSILKLMSGFAELNNRQEDKVMYDSLATDIKSAYNKRFYNSGNHYYGNNTVTANLISLRLGLVPDGDEQAVCDNAVKRTIEDCDGHVSVGVLGIQHLMRGLTEYGAKDLAYTIATNETYPSWGYMINRGATTIWELWNGDTADPAMNSRNHVMLLGDVLIWMYEDLAGIKNHPDSVGFKKILMAPVFPDGLDFVDASHMTPYGLVSSHWYRIGDSLEWNITVPANTTAELMAPASFKLKPVGKNSDKVTIKKDGDSWRATVPSGIYKLKTL